MKNILCTFSGSRYHSTTEKIVRDGPRYGAGKVWVFDDVWLKTQKEHCAATKWAFDHPKNRGVNWFCFKPYCITKALERCETGDIVCYTDADCWPIADMTPLFEMCERTGIVLFAACGHKQRQWSKRDTQILLGQDSDFFRDKQAGVARFMLFKKGAKFYGHYYADHGAYQSVITCQLTAESFLNEWLKHTCDQRANTFDESKLAQEYPKPDFIEARCEQAILTGLAHKYAIPLHREADQWGNTFKADFPQDTYGQIFESTGEYSYSPDGHRLGSKFRNVD